MPGTFVAAALFSALSAFGQLAAFPGAEGFGAYAAGGRNGDVYHVNTLNSSGVGSFADAIATVPAKGRTIVFDVSGWIHLAANTKLTASNVTIAGQTAPGGGVGFKDGTFWVYGDNVVIRHVRFRYGDQAAGGDCVDVDSAAVNVLFDHCAFEFGTDENFSTWNPPENLTMQDCINAWGLDSHSCGGLLNAQHMSVIRCLWAHNHTRNPKARPDGLLDWVNNVTFDWDIGFIMGDSTTPADWRANVRGCYFVSATSKSAALEKASLDRNGGTNFYLYLDNAILDGNNNGILDSSRTGYSMVSGSYGRSTNPFPQTANGLPVATNNPVVGVAPVPEPALLSYKKVLSCAGPLRFDAASALPLRDEVDTLLIGDVFTQARRIVSSQTQTGAGNGGFGTLDALPPPVDTDKDGLPDFWEIAMTLNLSRDDHTNQVPAGAYLPNSPAGYTVLEEYLHWLASPHVFGLRNQPVSVDLRRYVAGFTNRSPVYSVLNASNGTVAITNVVYARFWPASNFYGRSSFQFAVLDADGSTWTQTLLVCVSPSAPPKSIVWRGDGASNRWDNFTTANWSDGASLVTFGPGDTVLFDDSGSNLPAISVSSASLVPAAIAVQAGRNYTLGGTGALSGAATLTKAGTGTLVVANSGGNSLTGGVTVSEGSVNLSGSGSLGSGPLTLAGGAFGFSDGGTIGNDVIVDGAGTLTAWNNCWMNGPLSGSGTLHLAIASGDVITPQADWSSFSGTIDLGTSAGTLRLNHGSAVWGSTSTRFEVGSGILKNRSTGAPVIHLGSLSGGSAGRLYGSDQGGSFTDTYIVGELHEDSVFAGAIANGGAHSVQLVKTGAGRLELGGTGTFTGGLVVSNGVLVVNGSTGTGTVRVVAGTLGGTGRLNGAVSMLAGSILAPGNSAGVLSISNGLSVSNALLAFELSASPTGLNDQVVLTNSFLRLYGTNDLELTFSSGYLGSGTYVLVRGGTQTVGGVGNLRLMGLVAGSRQQINVSAPTGQLLLNVTGTVQTLLWRGTNSSAWDYNTTTNWLNASNAPDRFFHFDAVRFDDSATNGNVVIAGAVLPRSVEVSNNLRAFALGGAALAGSAMMLKSGTNALTLSGSNDYAGGTTILDGRIVLANDTANRWALGTGPVTLGGGSLRMYDNDATYNDIFWDLVVPSARTGTLYADGRCDLRGELSGGGTFNIFVNFVRTAIHGDWSAFTGSVSIASDAGYGEFRIDSDYYWPGLPGAHVDIVSNAVVTWIGNVNSGGTVCDLGALSGDVSASLYGCPVWGRTLNYRIGGRGTDAIFRGRILEQAAGDITAVEKVGTGVWTVSGTNTYSGGTTVRAGTLIVDTAGASGTGSGGVLVESGARIGGRGVIGGELTVAAGAALVPGDPSVPGTLSVDDAVNVSPGSTLVFRLGATSDSVQVNGALQLGGQLIVSNRGDFAGGVFPLFQHAGDLDLNALTIASAPTGYVYSIDTNTPGTVNLFAFTPFMQWQMASFGSLTAAQAQAEADWDGDGFPNLLEYAMGGNPTNFDALAGLGCELSNGVFRVQFARNTNAADVRIFVERIDGLRDAVAWVGVASNVGGSWGGATNVLEPGTSSPRSVQVMSGGASNRAVRVRVAKP